MKKSASTNKRASTNKASAKKKAKRFDEEALHKIPLRITDTTLRDAHQSLWATRMRTDDILGIIDVIDSAGYYSLEVWGGATFDVCMRFLRENPWERLRLIKKHARKTPLQMLLRGQNVLGYKNYPDDLLDRFCALACENGVDIFRIFDALNDSRNLERAIQSVKKYGGHAQGTLCYTISPVHTVTAYVENAREQVQMGIDSLCIKDMAGILSPISAERLISALVKEFDIPIQLHCHASSGMATATYVEGVRAGAGAIDCSISELAGFSAQPPVETLLSIFDETSYHANLDKDALREQCRYFKKIAVRRGPKRVVRSIIDPEILRHQIPGGMISNLHAQLEQQGALDRLEEVYEELPRVRADMGYPPLVTPTSQIVGIQSVINVLAGERYKMVPNEIKDYVRGLYGRPPARIDPAIKKKILGKEKPITCRPADLLDPVLPTAAQDVDPKYIHSEEDIISYCLFPEQALDYFKWRELPPDERPPIPADLEEEQAGPEPHPGAQPALPEPEPAAATEAFLTGEDYQSLEQLLASFARLGLGELAITRKGVRVQLKADGLDVGPADGPVAEHEPAETTAETTRAKPPPKTAPADKPAAKPRPDEPEGPTVDSPLNGTLYLSDEPGKPPFVNEGDEVQAGAVVCVVEAMKLFNEINAPSKCRIVGILVEHGTHVKKGQPLIQIEPL